MLPSNLLENLALATPKKNIIQWLLLSVLYTATIIVNDNFNLVTSIGLPKKYEAIIKLLGVISYIFLTTYQFQKTDSNEISTDNNPLTAYSKNNDGLHHIATAKATADNAQGNKQPPAKSSCPHAKATGNNT